MRAKNTLQQRFREPCKVSFPLRRLYCSHLNKCNSSPRGRCVINSFSLYTPVNVAAGRVQGAPASTPSYRAVRYVSTLCDAASATVHSSAVPHYPLLCQQHGTCGERGARTEAGELLHIEAH
eukprot:TRINITY_DN25048_c0_g1_i1.p1 TRINITY_DN25048_c0_g1~~TRINITY_DN25048_c0_g1_i1.p1  ORF type:complete len:122 (-),score=7.25 TRINITY_DN25048_c0_g1_i1:399-764(-)